MEGMREVAVEWNPSHGYKPGDRVLADMPPRVTKLPLHLGWWVHGAGYCPTRGVRDYAVMRHTETVEAVCMGAEREKPEPGRNITNERRYPG